MSNIKPHRRSAELRKLFLSWQSQKALTFVHTEQKHLDAQALLRILNPRTAMSILSWSQSVYGQDRKEIQYEIRAAEMAEAYCELWVIWGALADKNQGLIQQFKQSEALSVGVAALLSERTILQKASEQSKQRAMSAILKHAPSALFQKVPPLSLYLNRQESMVTASRYELPWMEATGVPATIMDLVAPQVVKKKNTSLKMHDFIYACIRRKKYKNAQKLIEAMDEHDIQYPPEAGTKWNEDFFTQKVKPPSEIMKHWMVQLPTLILNLQSTEAFEKSKNQERAQWLEFGLVLKEHSQGTDEQWLEVSNQLLKKNLAAAYAGISTKPSRPEATELGWTLAKLGLPLPDWKTIRSKADVVENRGLKRWAREIGVEIHQNEVFAPLISGYEEEILQQKISVPEATMDKTAQRAKRSL